MSTPRFHRLAVNDLRREASDAISLTFAIPDDLRDDYSFNRVKGPLMDLVVSDSNAL